MDKKFFTRKEQDALMTRLTLHIAVKLAIMRDDYTPGEMHIISGVSRNRISELLHHDKYKSVISVSNLKKFLDSDMIEFRELILLTKNDEERKYMEETFGDGRAENELIGQP